MKIEDIVQILNNRLREFKLSKDYASMNGDLERMNAADKEIIDLEDTLFKLNLLVDSSKSAAVKETVLTGVIADGSVAVLGEYNITSYATDPLHEEKIMYILSKMGVMDTAEKIENYIKGRYPGSPVSGEMVLSAALAYSVDARLMMAIMEQDSSFGTAGVAVRTLNPGNVGNDDSGNTRTYGSWQEGVTAVAEWLSRHRGSTVISEILDTPAIIPEISTSTPAMPTSTPAATSTPPIITTSSTTTTTTVVSTPTTTPSVATTTPETVPVVTATTSTPATSTSTPTIPTITTTTTATSTEQPPAVTQETATTTPEIEPVISSTTPDTTPTANITPPPASTTQETANTTPETEPEPTTSTEEQ